MNWKDYLPKNWQQLAIYVAVAGVIGLLTLFGLLSPGDVPLPDPPEPVYQAPLTTGGWVSDPEAVKAIQEQLEFKVFSDTPAGKSDEPLPKSVYMWDNFFKLFARPPPAKNQGQVGSCVGFGTANAVEGTLVTDIVAKKGGKEQFRHISPEIIYAGSRVQVGNGRISGDGSVGSWAAKFVQDYGVVSAENHGGIDLSVYSESRCRSLGKSGVPAALLEIAKENKVKDITFCKSWDSIKKALASGYAIAICSDQGFETPRDANGVKRPAGSWPHCMCINGYHTEGTKEYGHYENSWGNRPNEGPVGWGNPPDSGFWVDAAVIDRLAKNSRNEVIAFSPIRGWPKRELDWFVRARPQLRNDRLFAAIGTQFATLP